MKHRLTPVAAALLTTWTCSSPAHDADLPPTKDLGTVVVSGSQPTSLPTHIPTTVESITGQQVEQTINATDSEDALKYLPSLLVRKRYIGDYNHAVLSTRASGTGNSARSLVYADGILLSNLLGNGAAFAPRWGLVTPEEIERVDVLYGPFSAAYPGNSVGAVVDYVTRMPRQFEAHAKVGTFYQPFALYGTDAGYSGWQTSASLGNRQGAWSWWLDVNRLDSEGQPLVLATRAAPPAGTTGAVPGKNRVDQDWYILGTSTQYHTVQDHVKAKLAYDVAPEVRASYTLGWWHNDAQGHSDTYLRDAAGTPVYTSASDFPENRDHLEHLMHALSVKSHTMGVFDWDVSVSLYDYRKDIARKSGTLLPAAATGGAGSLTDQGGTGWNTLALKGVWRPEGAGSRHNVDFGVQLDSYRLRTAVSPLATNWLTDGVPDPRQAPSRFDGNTRLRSAYAQDAWRFSQRWKTVLGGRLEQWSAWGGFTRTPTGELHHPQREQRYFSPKAALAYQLGSDWVLRASTGRAVRMPTVSELYQGAPTATGSTNTNPDLRPEKSWTTEFSSEWTLPAGLLRATLFHEDTRDGLFSQLNAATNTTTVQNVGRLRTYGFESAWQTENLLITGLDLAGSVTYADSRIVENDGFPDTIGKRQVRVPKWRATLVATWRADDHWSTSFGARYGGTQYSTLNNSDTNGFAYQGSSRFFTTDVRVRYRLDRQWSAAVGVDNLNNDRYWNFHPYPQRTFIAELKFDL